MNWLLVVGCLLAVVLGNYNSPPRVRRNDIVDVLEKTEDVEEVKNVTAPVNETELAKDLQTDKNASSPITTALAEVRDGNADRQELGVYGQFGRNYLMENGKPYILCAQKNRTQTTSTMKKCFLDPTRPLDHLACMVVVWYNGNLLEYDGNPESNLIIQSQDCWTNQREAIQTCSKSPKCIIERNELGAGKQIFCCCTEHNCNDQFKIGDASQYTDESVGNHQVAVIKPKESGASVVQCLLLIFGCLCLLALIVLLVVIYKYRRGDFKKRSPSSIAPEDDRLIVSPKDPLEIQYGPRLGHGKYGDVWLGVWKRNANTELQVAVKKFTPANFKSYLNEVMIFNELCIKNYQGRNILKFYVSEQDSRDSGRIITEYHEMGNLHSYLKRNVITRQQEAISIIVSSLDALAFLHEERGYVHGNPKPAILHRDIKSHNILLRLDDNKLPIGVLSDFGLSMKCSQGVFAVQGVNEKFNVVGTQIYMAPELIHGATDFSTSYFRAIDVYAMAIVMWEVLSRTKISPNDEVPDYKEPLADKIREKKHEKRTENIIGILRELVVDKKERPEFRPQISNDPDLLKMKVTIEEMWEQEPDARITAACAHKRMEALLQESSIGYHSGEHLTGQSNGLPSSSASETDTVSSKSDTLGQEEGDDDQKTLHLPLVDLPGSEVIELLSLR